MSDNQTAVEWLIDKIFNEVDLKDSILKLAIQQAKEKEKEQIVEAYNAGQAKEAAQCFWSKGNLYFDNIYGGHN